MCQAYYIPLTYIVHSMWIFVLQGILNPILQKYKSGCEQTSSTVVPTGIDECPLCDYASCTWANESQSLVLSTASVWTSKSKISCMCTYRILPIPGGVPNYHITIAGHWPARSLESPPCTPSSSGNGCAACFETSPISINNAFAFNAVAPIMLMGIWLSIPNFKYENLA